MEIKRAALAAAGCLALMLSGCGGENGQEDAAADLDAADPDLHEVMDTADVPADRDEAETVPDVVPDTDDPAPDEAEPADVRDEEAASNPCEGTEPGDGGEGEPCAVTDHCDGRQYCNWTRCDCYPPGECVETSDCSNPGNDWPHDACTGHAECSAGLCEWICE